MICQWILTSFTRTLELVEAKVAEGGQYNLSEFSVTKLISPANLELIGNLSGCEAVRRDVPCDDLCYHAKYRSSSPALLVV